MLVADRPEMVEMSGVSGVPAVAGTLGSLLVVWPGYCCTIPGYGTVGEPVTGMGGHSMTESNVVGAMAGLTSPWNQVTTKQTESDQIKEEWGARKHCVHYKKTLRDSI